MEQIQKYLDIARQAQSKGKIVDIMDSPILDPNGYGGDIYFTVEYKNGSFDIVHQESELIYVAIDVEGILNNDNGDEPMSLDAFTKYMLG